MNLTDKIKGSNKQYLRFNPELASRSPEKGYLLLRISCGFEAGSVLRTADESMDWNPGYNETYSPRYLPNRGLRKCFHPLIYSQNGGELQGRQAFWANSPCLS
ncbi:hypothetical protein Btru_077708 [Bulinus truncatus]|nr:hypothetical protein Btru_077708 [Bulinus truncatus]